MTAPHTSAGVGGNGDVALEPCPLCGAAFRIAQEPHDNHPVAGKFYIYHDYGPIGSAARSCVIEVYRHFDSREEAVEAWNRRSPASHTAVEPVAELVERLTDLGNLAFETGILHDTEACHDAASALTAQAASLAKAETSHAAARENFLTMQDAASKLLARAEAAEKRLAELEADTARLDWLERQHVVVRTPLPYGSQACLEASPTYEEGEEPGPSDLRAEADRAIRLTSPKENSIG